MTTPTSRKQTPHGTHDGYVNHGCRCDACTAAHRVYTRQWRQSNGYYDAIGRRRAQAEAARRYRTRYPAVWAKLLREETARARAERAGRGEVAS